MTKGVDKKRRRKSDLMALKAWEHKMKIKKAPDGFSAGHWKQELESYSETARKYRKTASGD